MATTIEQQYSQFKDLLASSRIAGLCTDIDDTVADTNRFWTQNMIKKFGNPEKLGPDELIKKYRYVKNIPYWQCEEVERWITNQHTSNYGVLAIPLIKDANNAIHKINEIYPMIGYLTGRQESTLCGTKKWLSDHSFPELHILNQPTDYVMHELGVSNGNEWKAKTLEYLFPQITGTIDDNEGLLTYLSPDYEGTIYLFSHEFCEDTDLNVVCCPDWNEVINEVKNRHY